MLVTNMLILSIVKRTEVETLLERNFHQINLNVIVIFVLYHFLKCYYKVQPIKLQNIFFFLFSSLIFELIPNWLAQICPG